MTVLTTPRDRERSLFDQSIMMLEAARDEGGYSYKGIEAVHFTSRLWMIIIEDLGQSGKWTASRIARLVDLDRNIHSQGTGGNPQETSRDYDSIIDITKTIRDGI